MRKTVALVLMLSILLCAGNAMAEEYQRQGRVIDVDWNDECVTIVDDCGDFWYWMDDPDDWEYGDVVDMVIDDEGTASIWDDSLLEVVYLYGSA